MFLAKISRMHRSAFALLLAVVATTTALSVIAPRAAGADSAQVERGRYLVRQVGMCADCHGSALHGQTIDFLAPNLPVAHRSMPIAGLHYWSTQQAITFFVTGRTPAGTLARPPMPQYRYHADDAAAIVAYLKTLP